ncbi:MAG: SMP-30/gluconolactonase/LRE family protein, partial [Chloroflexi bacterium]|nr:SMP-30/gluconolactonase/LRE family protein [Chloroflexota bacterium]
SPGSASVWNSNSNNGNGTLLSLDGRLLVAEENPPKICSYRIGPSGPQDAKVQAIPSKAPNDLTQLANGRIYFSCPDWSTTPATQGVYRLDPNGAVTLVKNGLYQPNGLEASNDGTKLYVAESASGPGGGNSLKRWWVFPINPDGSLGTGSIFFQPSTTNYNDPDGMTIDERGNLYFCGMGGVWIVSPQGVQLDMIPIPEFVTNVCFGGPENKTLYITCQDKVYSLAMQFRGGGHGGEMSAQIPETSTAPTIDGSIDGIWATAAARPTPNVLLGSVSNDADLSSEWRAMWDANYLYILVDVNDDIHYNDSDYSTPWLDDAVELYIDADNSMGSTYDGTHDYELIFRWNDPDIHLGVYSATNISGMTFAMVNRTGGHVFEAKLPWSAMGVAMGMGSQFGLDVHLCDDDDGGDREAKKAWHVTNDNAWQWPYMLATVQLSGFSAAAPGQASNPSPANGITGVSTMTTLSWMAGNGTISHDVYFGTAATPPFIQNQTATATTYNPGMLAGNTTYHWRIDEKNGAGTTTGVVWSFTTGAEPEGIVFKRSSQSFAENGTTLSWSHTTDSASNKLLVVGLAAEDTSTSDLVISSVKYNGVNMHLVADSNSIVGAGMRMKTDLYYLLDSELPSSGTYTVTVTYAGIIAYMNGGAVSLAHVKQLAREAVAIKSNTNLSTISTNITTLTNGAWVIDVVGSGEVGSFTTTTTGMVERWDVASGTSKGAGSTKPVETAGSTTMSWDTPALRLSHSVAAFAPAVP